MTDAFAANGRHIASFEVKPYPKPQSADSVTPAFEAYAYGKIVQELRSDNAVIKSKAVVAAREMLCMPLKHIQCIAAGITPALVELLGMDSNEDLRAAAATSLQLLVAKEVGCRDMLQHNGLPQLLQLLKQPKPAVKDAAYGTLCSAARFEVLRLALMRQQGALGQLMEHVQQEEPARAAHALELLVQVTQVRHNQDALSNLIHVVHAVPKLAAIIRSNSTADPVRLGAVKLLAALMSTQEEGRTQAVDAGCTLVLLELLSSSSEVMACAAAAGLMMVSLSKQGKAVLHEAHAVCQVVNVLTAQQQHLKQLLPGSPREEFIVNILQLITNLAEHPHCRSQLQHAAFSGLDSMLCAMQQQAAHGSALIPKAANTAARMINFSTWPGVCTSRTYAGIDIGAVKFKF